jgi:gliding motility-associated-like protein
MNTLFTTKNMSKKIHFFCILALFLFQNSFAQRGKDGSLTVTTTNKIVNEYAVLTADAVVGNASIVVDNNGLNTNNRFAGPLSQGDLIMIVQVQGANIFGNTFVDVNGVTFGSPKDSSWGEILNYNNCGNYEIVEVFGVSGTNIISFNCSLLNNYTAAGKVQIVRMPRYTNLTVNNAASIVCDIWNGSKGGVVAIEVDGATVINGAVAATGRGFRGGVVDNQSSFGSNDIASMSAIYGGEKGEGIAGFQNDYNVVGGRYCKGSPANGGGGGNMHNGGGGGGANGGNPLNWIAVGNPSTATANWANAWNLEWPGLATATSSGGGKGGYTASINNQNALTIGPNVVSWGGDNRNKQGGYGGRPLNYTSNKIFFGGGGGAGDGNNGFTGAGGASGGVIYMLCYGAVAGTGAIVSNGNNGSNAAGTASINGIAGNDGAGGGGAGGTIFLQTTAAISSVTISANGGEGGDQLLTRGFFAPAITEAQGPGGGGSGGYINTTVAATTTVNGGIHGTTDSPSLSEFPPNGATSGGLGTAINNLPAYDISVSDVAVCAGNTATLTATIIGTIPAGAFITWYDAPFGGTVLGTGASFTTPVINANTTYYVGFCPASFKKAVNVTISPGVTTSNAGVNQQVCQNNATLDANNPTTGTGVWSVVSGTGNFANANLFNTTVTNLSPGNNVFEWTISSPGCPPSQSQVTITVIPTPTADAGVDQQLCNNSATLAATGTGSWSIFNGTGNFSNTNNPVSTVSNLAVGLNSFIWTLTLPGCVPVQDTVDILVSAAVSIADAGNNQQLCSDNITLNAIAPVVGIGTWTLVAGSGAIVDVNSNVSVVNGLSLGANVFEWTVSAPGCPSTTDQVTITVDAILPVADAGIDQTLCTTSTLLAANAAPLGSTGTWSVLAGSPSFNDINNNNTNVSNLSVGINTLIWTIQNPACPAVTDTMLITVASALSTADAGVDQQICSSSTTLNAVLPNIGIGSWTLVSGTATIADPSLNNSAITGLAAGPNVFEWTVSGAGCPSNSDQITITVNLLNAIADAGTNASVCGNTTSLSANAAPAGTNGTWSSPQVGITFSNANDQNATVSNLQNGANTLIWTFTNSVGCPPSSDTIIVNSASNPSAANAGTDKTICADNTSLSAIAPTSGSGVWSVFSGTANITNASSPNTTVNGLLPGDVIFVWTVSNAPCPSNTDTITITVFPALSPAIAGADASLCDTQYSMNATAPTSGTGTWTLLSGSGTISNVNAANASISNLGVGVNTFQWTVANGTCPDLTDQMSIVVAEPPSTAAAGGDIQTCTQTTQLSATSPQIGTGVWTVTQGNAAISNPTNPNTSVTILSPGGATFSWQVTSGNCPPSSDDLNVVLLNGSNDANAGEDVTIAIGDSTTLNGSGGTINGWDPPRGLSCIDCPNPIANPDTTTMYYLSVTDINGCTSIDSVLITVDETKYWYLPNAFTPDANGVNDVLYFYGIGVKEFILQVFDRWGAKVFETTDAKVGWDGNYKGKAAISGVYAYQLTITFKSTEVEQVKGNLNLIRN